MRIQSIATFAALAAVTVAKPHRHVHRHAHEVDRRAALPDKVVYAPVAIETVIKFVLDGHDISEEEVRQGIANGTLEWDGDGNLFSSTKLPIALATPPPSLPSKPEEKPQAPQERPAEPQPQSTPQPAPAPVQKPAAKSSAVAAPLLSSQPSPAPQSDSSLATADQLVDKDGNCASCDKEFPGGTIPCAQFPYGYGAMPAQQEGLGGWSGVQDPVYSGNDGFNDITTVTKEMCKGKGCCSSGNYCSYACPNPYLKQSFPKKQGVTGQTVGGLYCNENGMLEMADGSLAKTLCGKSSNMVTVKVQNDLDKPVSICRTDYPGTESMTFPLTVGPGQTGYLANPDTSKYFFWQGKATSAHYYVNNAGVSEAEGCTWSKPEYGHGNWAPLIFGTSFDDINMHQGFSSIKQNELNKGADLNYSITFKGDGVNSPCSYNAKTHQYCMDGRCWTDKSIGCTASVNPGHTLTLVLSN